MNDSNPPKPKLRWYQFSLRTLLIVVLVLGVGLGLLGRKVQRIRREEEAALKFVEMRGMIRADRSRSMLDHWVHRLCGGIPECPVTNVSLDGTDVTNTDLEYLKDLPDLEFLSLTYTRVTDTGLEHLKELTNLRELHLANTQVTDEGVEKFQKALPNCEVFR